MSGPKSLACDYVGVNDVPLDPVQMLRLRVGITDRVQGLRPIDNAIHPQNHSDMNAASAPRSGWFGFNIRAFATRCPH
jgi:hypothetical protein